ncbi:uncharacterized protein LOC144440534 [Glandiceps talaboti]
MTTPLRKLLSLVPLPCVVQVNGRDTLPDEFEDKDVLLFHKTITVHKVRATDEEGRDLLLPLTGQQVYEILPIDPCHDDKIFIGINQIVQHKVLPKFLRVLGGLYFGGPVSFIEEGDVIEILGTDVDDINDVDNGAGNDYALPGTDKLKVLLVRYMDETIRISSDNHSMSMFSTMIQPQPQPLYKLIKEQLPMRVRIPVESGTPNVQQRGILRLESLVTEEHILATHPRKKEILSIPVDLPLHVFKIANNKVDIATVLGALEGLYPSINTSWNVHELGNEVLPSRFVAKPRPLDVVFESWSNSYEGKEKAKEVLKDLLDHYQTKISTLEQERDLFQWYRRSSKAKQGPSECSLEEPRRNLPDLPLRNPNPPSVLPNTTQAEKADYCAPANEHSDQEFYDSDNDNDYDTLYDTIESDTRNRCYHDYKLMCDSLKETLVEREKRILKLSEELREQTTMQKEIAEDKRRLIAENEKLLSENKKLSKGGQDSRLSSRSFRFFKRRSHSTSSCIDDLRKQAGVADLTKREEETDLRRQEGVANMSTQEVCELLVNLNLPQYRGQFQKETIDGYLLSHLGEDILVNDLNMTRLHARKLTLHIEKRM